MFVTSHQDAGDWHCNPDAEARVAAEFKPGTITLDGRADDWHDIYGFEFSLLPALDPDQDKEYKGGKMIVKALHDGNNIYFLLQVDGDYVYSKGNDKGCPSVALMFQVGDKATYRRMGGCQESPTTCNRTSCHGFEVDIMHFSIGNAIPGRLYGWNPVDSRDGNGGDRYGHLVDLYAWSPHCQYLDGISPSGNDSSSQNDWQGAWWHSSFTTHSGFLAEDSPFTLSSGQKGTYFFEFSRPLRTRDRLQQDVQFTIGQSSKFSAAYWYPDGGNPWHGSGHYSISCDWAYIDISRGSSNSVKGASSGSSWEAASAFALLLSVVSICLSIFVGYRVSQGRNVHFTSIDGL